MQKSSMSQFNLKLLHSVSQNSRITVVFHILAIQSHVSTHFHLEEDDTGQKHGCIFLFVCTNFTVPKLSSPFISNIWWNLNGSDCLCESLSCIACNYVFLFCIIQMLPLIYMLWGSQKERKTSALSQSALKWYSIIETISTQTKESDQFRL